MNILSGGLTECLGEPRHVGVSTAGSLHTITVLPIPQGKVKSDKEATTMIQVLASLFQEVVLDHEVWFA